ncbi:hypothetical protein [Variovorax paradoxus]|uniref:hypothetical protein n=1 Tax=Variovorax paradoxus TaxID=34073 RepID=UPI003ECECA19
MGIDIYIRREDAVRYLEDQNFEVVFSDEPVAPSSPGNAAMPALELSEILSETTSGSDRTLEGPEPRRNGSNPPKRKNNDWRDGGAEKMALFVQSNSWSAAEKKYGCTEKALKRALARHHIDEPKPRRNSVFSIVS